MGDRPTIRPISEIANGVETYYATDSFAWAHPTEPGELKAKRRIVDPARFHVAELDGAPAGVAGSFPFELTLPGGATVPIAGITDVGVIPTQRRRGVLSALMANEHDQAVARGEVAAALTASEAVIYRRFGYGVATLKRQVTVHTRHSAFHPAWTPPPGRVQPLSRPEAHQVVAEVYDRLRVDRPGWLSRSEPFWSVIFGDDELYIGGGRSLLVMVHTDESGRPDGYAVYKVNPGRDEAMRSSSEIEVWELEAVDDATELALWRVLLDHDLIGRVTAWVPPDHLLVEALADARALQPSHEADNVWLRILDVAAVLEARTYAADDDLVLHVVDPSRPDTTGTYRIQTSGAGGKCERVDAPGSTPDGARPNGADLSIDIADLSSLALGGASARRMVRVGRLVEQTTGIAERIDAAFGIDPMPNCTTRF